MCPSRYRRLSTAFVARLLATYLERSPGRREIPPLLPKQNAMANLDVLSSMPTIAALGMLAAAALCDIGFRTLPDTFSAALLACGGVVHFAAGDLGPAVVATLAVAAVAMLVWR